MSDLALVTGGAGWLGSRLVGALVQGLPECGGMPQPNPRMRVRCLVLPGEDASLIEELGDRVEIVRGDITRAEDCARLCEGARGAAVFHVAGIIHPQRRADFYRVNVDGTRNVLEAAIAAGARRAVVMSSNSPCGSNPHPDHVFDEASPYHPYMHYGRSKMQMEQAVCGLRPSGQDRDRDHPGALVLRPQPAAAADRCSSA